MQTILGLQTMEYNIEINEIRLKQLQAMFREIFFQIGRSTLSQSATMSSILNTLILGYSELNLSLTFKNEPQSRSHHLKALLALKSTRENIHDWQRELQMANQSDNLLDTLIENCQAIEKTLMDQ